MAYNYEANRIHSHCYLVGRVSKAWTRPNQDDRHGKQPRAERRGPLGHNRDPRLRLDVLVRMLDAVLHLWGRLYGSAERTYDGYPERSDVFRQSHTQRGIVPKPQLLSGDVLPAVVRRPRELD